MSEPINDAVQLKKELDSLRPINSEQEARIMQKFRLDWNYHSNNLEGNSLTYGETKALLLFGVTAQGKPLRDHFEITGHNEAINWVIDLLKGSTELTEHFIRQLHVLLLKESSYKDAQTAAGKPTRRLIEVGKYKTQPNHVITVTGETFFFATPEETPAKMHDLIEWFRKEKSKPDINPIILAALFHYRFIRVHPFDDGNGRVARILMNFILMQFGYPPVIIKTEDKENYYSVLRLADADQIEPFIDYIAENLVRSLEIMIRGAKGENIEEPEDFDRELFLLEQKIRNLGKKIDVLRSPEAIRQVFERSISPLINALIESGRKFDSFYLKKWFKLYLDMQPVLGEYDNTIHYAKEEMNNDLQKEYNEITLLYFYDSFNQDILGASDYSSKIIIRFHRTKYAITNDGTPQTTPDIKPIEIEKLYNEQLSVDEINYIAKIQALMHKDFIEKRVSYFEKNKDLKG